MSQEVKFSAVRSVQSLCFTYYYRLIATSRARMKAFVLTKNQNDTPTADKSSGSPRASPSSGLAAPES